MIRTWYVIILVKTLWCKKLWIVVISGPAFGGLCLLCRSRKLSGFYRDFTRGTAVVFQLRCELNLIAFAMMVSALKSDFFGQFCHRELSWELCHILKIFQKVPPDGLRIYEQVSTTLCTVLTLNSPRQGDSKKASWRSKVSVHRYGSQLI